MFVLDASVYVAAVSEADLHHLRSIQWLEACLEERRQLCAPNLFAVEVASAIRRLSGSRRTADRAVSRLLDRAFVELMPLTPERALGAAAVAAKAGLRGADAIYLALAQELGAALVTLDRQQLERGRQVVTVRKP